MTTKIIAIFCTLMLLIAFYLVLSSKEKNLLNGSPKVDFGNWWKNNQSFYSGSEFGFKFRKTKYLSFEFTTESKAEQSIQILIDQKSYFLNSPNLDTQKLTISTEFSKTQAVTVRYFCVFFEFPCNIKVKGIYAQNSVEISPFKPHTMTLSILGDSISTIYGKNNYSEIIAQDLGYELHNASIFGSTVTKVKNADNAILRYKKDLLTNNSNIILIVLGSNDAASNVPLDKFENDYSEIVKNVQKVNSGKIFLVGALPRRDVSDITITSYNNIIQKVAEENNLIYIDTNSFLEPQDFTDGLHPTIESQKKIADQFKSIIFSSLK